MYKITTINEINEINAYAKEFRKSEAYAIAIKHCKLELYAIPFLIEILRQYNLPFIDENWLTTDLVEELPLEWTWLLPLRPILLTVPNKTIVTEIKNETSFGELMLQMQTLLKDYMPTNELITNVYLEYVFSQHIPVINPFVISGKIKCSEIQNDKIVDIYDLNNLEHLEV